MSAQCFEKGGAEGSGRGASCSKRLLFFRDAMKGPILIFVFPIRQGKRTPMARRTLTNFGKPERHSPRGSFPTVDIPKVDHDMLILRDCYLPNIKDAVLARSYQQ